MLGGLFKPRTTDVARSNRERLRVAIAELDRARRAVAPAEAVVERIDAEIAEVGRKVRLAEETDEAAKAAHMAWRSGGRDPESTEHERLRAVADEAQRIAESAEQSVEDARRDLRRAEDAVKSKRFAVDNAEDEITGAIGVILAEEAAPLLRQLEDEAAAYRATRAKVIGLRWVLAQKYTLATRNKMNPAAEGEGVVMNALHRAVIKSFDDERKEPRASDSINKTNHEEKWFASLEAPWRERAKALRADPDSEK